MKAIDKIAKQYKNKYLIVIVGPTAVGKTSVAIEVALRLKTEIISADSRQFYKELSAATSIPSPEQLAAVQHHFIQHLSIASDYNVFKYEQDVLSLLQELFQNVDVVVLTGGSGMYLDTVCRGIDFIPDAVPEIRERLNQIFLNEGLEPLRKDLLLLDPVAYKNIDLANHKRVIRALEVIHSTGKAYSAHLTKTQSSRPFQIIKIGLNTNRPLLYNRINNRVEEFIANGLEYEARQLFPLKHLVALQTIGYKEMFDYFDNKISMKQAIEKIKVNTRRYAKKQLTWFMRDKEIMWFTPDNIDLIMEYLNSKLTEGS